MFVKKAKVYICLSPHINSIVSDYAMIVNEQLNKILFNITQLITGLNINYKDVNEIKILVEKYRLIFIEIAEDIKLNIAEDITEVKPPLKSECSEDIQLQTFNFKENYDEGKKLKQ